MKMRKKKYELTKTQDLMETFHDVGQFYWGKKNYGYLVKEFILMQLE